jgi:hypothetical protein
MPRLLLIVMFAASGARGALPEPRIDRAMALRPRLFLQ